MFLLEKKKKREGGGGGPNGNYLYVNKDLIACKTPMFDYY